MVSLSLYLFLIISTYLYPSLVIPFSFIFLSLLLSFSFSISFSLSLLYTLGFSFTSPLFCYLSLSCCFLCLFLWPSLSLPILPPSLGYFSIYFDIYLKSITDTSLSLLFLGPIFCHLMSRLTSQCYPFLWEGWNCKPNSCPWRFCSMLSSSTTTCLYTLLTWQNFSIKDESVLEEC